MKRKRPTPSQRRVAALAARNPDLATAIATSVGQVPVSDIAADVALRCLRGLAVTVEQLAARVAALEQPAVDTGPLADRVAALEAIVAPVPVQLAGLHTRNVMILDQVGALARDIRGF